MAAFNLSFRIITIQSSQTPRSINHLVNTLIYQTPPIPQKEPTQQTKQDICGKYGQFYSTPPNIILGGISVGWPLWT